MIVINKLLSLFLNSTYDSQFNPPRVLKETLGRLVSLCTIIIITTTHNQGVWLAIIGVWLAILPDIPYMDKCINST